MIRKIVWEHWHEPENDPIQDFVDSIINDSEFDEDMMDGDQNMMIPMHTHVNTPFGPYPSNDPLRPTEMFDCWIMHANFDIDKSAILHINRAPGVEAAKLMTRYRCCIGVSPLFNIRDVRTHLNNVLCGSPDNDLVNSIKSQIQHYQHWVIFKDSSGGIKYHSATTKNDPAYMAKYKSLELTGNEIIDSDKDRGLSV